MQRQDVDYYAVLGVEANASIDDIRAAFRKLALKHHPDRHPPESREKAERLMKDVNAAKETLTDPQRRQQYDLTRRLPQSRNASYHPFQASSFHARYNFHSRFPFFDFGPERPKEPVSHTIKFSATLEELFDFRVKKLRVSVPTGDPFFPTKSAIVSVKLGPELREGEIIDVQCQELEAFARIRLKFELRKHPLFERSGVRDLRAEIKLTAEQAQNGARGLGIMGVDKSQVSLDRPRSIVCGSNVVLEGKGMPYKNKRGEAARGNLCISFLIEQNKSLASTASGVVFPVDCNNATQGLKADQNSLITFTIKFRATLEELHAYKSKKLKITVPTNNVAQPEKSAIVSVTVGTELDNDSMIFIECPELAAYGRIRLKLKLQEHKLYVRSGIRDLKAVINLTADQAEDGAQDLYLEGIDKERIFLSCSAPITTGQTKIFHGKGMCLKTKDGTEGRGDLFTTFNVVPNDSPSASLTTGNVSIIPKEKKLGSKRHSPADSAKPSSKRTKVSPQRSGREEVESIIDVDEVPDGVQASTKKYIPKADYTSKRDHCAKIFTDFLSSQYRSKTEGNNGFQEEAENKGAGRSRFGGTSDDNDDDVEVLIDSDDEPREVGAKNSRGSQPKDDSVHSKDSMDSDILDHDDIPPLNTFNKPFLESLAEYCAENDFETDPTFSFSIVGSGTYNDPIIVPDA